MSVGIRIDNPGAFLELRIQQVKMDAAIRKSIRDLAGEYRARLVADLSRPKAGITYPARGARAGRGVFVRRSTPAYQASRPGEPPARRTGVLLQAIRTKYPSAAKGYGAKVFAHRGQAFYRHFLEFGAKPASKGKGRTGYRAPRPAFSPLQAALERELSGRVLAAVDAFAAGR